MANPQVEDGYTTIANEIIEHLWKVNLSAYESRALWFLFRKTYGWSKKTDRITLSQFSKEIGLDRRLVHRALHSLSSKKMIVIYKDDSGNVSYGFQKDYDKWQLSSKKMTVIDSDDALSSKKMMVVSSKEIPTKETITKEIPPISPKKHGGYSDDFLSFWSSYPKKSGSKKAAYSEWKKLNGDKPPLNTVLAAIKKQIEWRSRAGPNEFRPEWKDPERWIKNRMWEAEIEQPKPKSVFS